MSPRSMGTNTKGPAPAPRKKKVSATETAVNEARNNTLTRFAAFFEAAEGVWAINSGYALDCSTASKIAVTGACYVTAAS